jgi:hypothetical protein
VLGAALRISLALAIPFPQRNTLLGLQTKPVIIASTPRARQLG